MPATLPRKKTNCNMKNLLSKAGLLFLALTLCFFSACEDDDDPPVSIDPAITSLRFLNEVVIAPDTIDGSVVGGLSGIDRNDDTYYLISDDGNTPTRFYTASFDVTSTGIQNFSLDTQVEFLQEDGTSFPSGAVDPEAIRYVADGGGYLVWTSEGSINNGVDPSVRTAMPDGSSRAVFDVPANFRADATDGRGPRHNGVMEGISLSADGNGFWLGMELPLEQDGPAPTTTDTDSPVRITYMSKSGEAGRQFAYELDPVVREGGFTVNGLVELLEYDTDKFLVLERSFSTGYTDGGNDVKIYQVDASGATDVSDIDALADATYTKVTKTLLFDFETVRSQLTQGVVDNIEGMTFGPELPNGNRSLILVADDNFSAFGTQYSQLIALEVE